ncbi:hypothetical protein [Streptomyces sp. NPDC001139]
MIGADVVADGVDEVPEMALGCHSPPHLAKTVAGAVEHRMRVGPDKGVVGAGAEGGGVGTQGLGEGGIAFDCGPGGEQGVLSGAGGPLVLMGTQGVACSALDELVDPDALVRDIRGCGR